MTSFTSQYTELFNISSRNHLYIYFATLFLIIHKTKTKKGFTSQKATKVHMELLGGWGVGKRARLPQPPHYLP